MCVSYFVQYKKEHAVKASALLAQGQKKITQCREKMAWATIAIISVYNKTISCLSSTIEKVVYSA